MSWTEDHDKAESGLRVVKFYDDNGASAIRKVQCTYTVHDCMCGACATVRCVGVGVLITAAITGSEIWGGGYHFTSLQCRHQIQGIYVNMYTYY